MTATCSPASSRCDDEPASNEYIRTAIVSDLWPHARSFCWQIFAEIDEDSSGAIERAELEDWWHANSTNAELLKKFETAFDELERRSQCIGISLEEFKRAVVAVAADHWLPRTDPETGLQYYYHQLTHEVRDVDPGGEDYEECVRQFFEEAGLQRTVVEL